ncbi:MAG: dUTPase [Bacillota bacterium]
MDKLEIIFELQQAFDSSLEKLRSLHGISTEQWIQKETLAMISELSELIDEVNFKWWKNPKELDYGAIKEELVDILHFFVSMCLKVGMDAEELFALYKKKNLENFRRQQGKSDKQGYQAV